MTLLACFLWLGGGQEKVGASGFQNKQTLPDRTFPNQLFLGHITKMEFWMNFFDIDIFYLLL